MPTYSISGQAVAGAMLTLAGTASAVTYANPLGAYSFTGLSAGTYTVTPSKTGLLFNPTVSTSLVITAANITGVNFLVTSLNVAGSNTTLQDIIDHVVTFGDIEPIFNVGGYTIEPARTIASSVMAAICATTFPHKWNEIQLPFFYTFSWQQDYALVNPDGSSVYGVEWLNRGVGIDINESGPPKPWVNIECGRSLQMRTGTYSSNSSIMSDPGFVVCGLPNASLYYGVWGQPEIGGPTIGNNPQAGSVYTAPTGNYSQPANPISQIIDANGNLLVITTYGTEGSTAPLAPVNAPPGTTVSGSGASTVWTVVDPFGYGVRIVDVPSQTGVVWQFRLIGQMPPVNFARVLSNGE